MQETKIGLFQRSDQNDLITVILEINFRPPRIIDVEPVFLISFFSYFCFSPFILSLGLLS